MRSLAQEQNSPCGLLMSYLFGIGQHTVNLASYRTIEVIVWKHSLWLGSAERIPLKLSNQIFAKDVTCVPMHKDVATVSHPICNTNLS